MSNRMKYELWDFAARLCAVIPPLASSLFFFPEWLRQSPKATFSGTFLIACLVCMIPFWKKLMTVGKSLSGTSMPVFWLVVFGVFFMLKEIVDKVIYISLFGLIGSVISIGVCCIRNRYKEHDVNAEEKDKET